MQSPRRRIRGITVCGVVGLLALGGPRSAWARAATCRPGTAHWTDQTPNPANVDWPTTSVAAGKQLSTIHFLPRYSLERRAPTAQLVTAQEDARSSELRHHLAGWLVVLAGLFLIVEPTLRKRWPASRYAWPLCFLVCGLFLLAFSDEELWPLGPVNWLYGVTHDPEDLQHKVFAVILIVLGAIEIQRARGVLTSAWAASVFPTLALVGSFMLLLHRHELGMSGANDMAVMQHVQAQHVTFAIAGGGIAVAKALSELRTHWQIIFLRSWPILLVTLGVLLLRYVES